MFSGKFPKFVQLFIPEQTAGFSLLSTSVQGQRTSLHTLYNLPTLNTQNLELKGKFKQNLEIRDGEHFFRQHSAKELKGL